MRTIDVTFVISGGKILLKIHILCVCVCKIDERTSNFKIFACGAKKTQRLYKVELYKLLWNPGHPRREGTQNTKLCTDALSAQDTCIWSYQVNFQKSSRNPRNAALKKKRAYMFKQNLKRRKIGPKKMSLNRKGTIVQKVFLINFWKTFRGLCMHENTELCFMGSICSG